MFRWIAGLISVALVRSFSTGVDTCVNQAQHGAWAMGCSPVGCQQLGSVLPPAYMIDVQDFMGQRVREYTPNTNYSVVLRSTNTSTAPCSAQSCFRGFVMNVGKGNLQRSNFQAVSDATVGAGVLTVHPDSALHSRSMISCPNGITHMNNDFNRNVRAIWTSPDANTGFVTFKAIIVSTQRGLNYIASFTIPELQNQTLSISSSPSTSPSIRPTRSANRTSTSTNTPAGSMSASRSSSGSPSWSSSFSPSISNTPTPSNTLSGQASASNSPSNTMSRSWSASVTAMSSTTSTGSVSRTSSPTSSPSDSGSVSESTTPSASRTYSPTLSPSIPPSQSASLTSFPTPDTTSTSSASSSTTPSANATNNNIVIVQAGTPPVDSSNHAVGIAVGVVACLALVVIAVATYQRKFQRKRPHSSRVVIMPIERVTLNPTLVSPVTSMRHLDIQSTGRQTFEPQAVRSEV